MEGRSLPKRRPDPDVAAVHLDDQLGDGEPKAGAAFSFRVRAINLMELLEDARLVLCGDAWPRIDHADVEMTVDHLGGHAHLAGVGELDGITNEVEEHLGEALLIAEANGQRFRHLGLEGKLLVLRHGLRG